jgi:formylglycine-generating enzyme required for sulfatase activity
MAVPSASADRKITVPDGFAIVGTDASDLKNQLANPRARPEWYADETPQKKLKVGAFMMDATEVSNEEYKQLNPKHSFPKNLANHPVVNVMWEEADEFCKKSGGRLPTEAEWERAARGDDGRIYPWGNEFTPENVIFVGTGGTDAKLKVGSFTLKKSGSTQLGGTQPAGSIEKGKSPFGLYDMAGNAWEWVDGWHDKEKELRLLKGGSWLTPRESVRSAARLGDSGTTRFNDFGFRCAYDID